MSMKRWKVLACTLTVGVGGLVVYGAPFGKKVEAQNAKDKAPVTVSETKAKDSPVPRTNYNGHVIGLQAPGVPTPELDVPIKATYFGPGPFPPLKEEAPPPMPLKGLEFDIDIPLPPPNVKKIADDTAPPPFVLPLPVAPTEPMSTPVIIPVRGQTAEPPLLLPAGGVDKKDAPKKFDTPKVPDLPKVEETKPPVKIDIPLTPLPEIKPEIKLEPKPAPKVLTPPAPLEPLPPLKADPKPAPPVTNDLLPMPTPPLTPTPDKKPDVVKANDMAKLKMLLRLGDGKPRFEIRNTQTTELLMKVYGDKIDIQSADAKSTLTGVTANGNVRFTAPGVEGTCDTLTILSTTGEVMLKGNIRLKTKYGKTTSELTAEKMVYQIGTQGLVAPSKPTTPTGTTASHVRD